MDFLLGVDTKTINQAKQEKVIIIKTKQNNNHKYTTRKQDLLRKSLVREKPRNHLKRFIIWERL